MILIFLQPSSWDNFDDLAISLEPRHLLTPATWDCNLVCLKFPPLVPSELISQIQITILFILFSLTTYSYIRSHIYDYSVCTSLSGSCTHVPVDPTQINREKVAESSQLVGACLHIIWWWCCRSCGQTNLPQANGRDMCRMSLATVGVRATKWKTANNGIYIPYTYIVYIYI